jgi:IS30 family transposase
MAPLSLTEPPARGLRLSFREREEIAHCVAQRMSIRQIARVLGRHPSTVMRELARNGNNRYRPEFRPGVRPRGAVAAAARYYPSEAQRWAEARSVRPRPAKLDTDPRLRAEVQDRLKRNHSPEQIARRLREDFPDDVEMRVSHETIYRALYVQGRGGLKRELVTHLRTGRTLRRPRRTPTERRGRIAGMVNISERPAEVEDRAVPGHWEGDLIRGSQASRSAIGTLVERMTGFVLLLHLPESHGALAVQQAMIEKMSRLPEILRRTLTWDQGSEMTNHAQIAAATHLEIYFCDPQAPCQRSVETQQGPLAARQQREHQRPAAPVPAPSPRLPHPHPSRLRCHRTRAQPASSTDPRVQDTITGTSRGVALTA